MQICDTFYDTFLKNKKQKKHTHTDYESNDLTVVLYIKKNLSDY